MDTLPVIVEILTARTEPVAGGATVGWLWDAIGAPLQDGAYPTDEAFSATMSAERHLRGGAGAERIREEVAIALRIRGDELDDAAVARDGEATAALSRHDEAIRRASGIDTEWAPDARFGAGWRHPHAGCGGMRDRDLDRVAVNLDSADDARRWAERCRQESHAYRVLAGDLRTAADRIWPDRIE